ncbi:response regulator FixJ [Phenylobacterium sp.]|uniref:response regulator FixJ n=1 Tax=Phenylobacterium sp. TaxID=1871053 RepID=UPI002E36664E|nr:response regulator FixJ [Phenylobacterium sp.]HEX2558610.1 response regulator FixJ [Phenylobacterium sp.]
MTEPVVHVIDDDPAMRESLTFLLDSAGLTAATYESAVEFLAAGDPAPGCIVSDVRMPQMSGLELVRRLKERSVPHPVIMITGHGDVPLAVEAMKAGVVDFLEKPFDDEALLAAIRAAISSRGRQAEEEDERRRFHALLEQLSPRETDVLRGIVAGKPNKVIAFDLGISPRTVEVYRANVMTKTGAGSLSELVRMALLAGF